MSSAVTIASVVGAATAVAGTAYSMSQGGGSAGGGQIQETAQGRKAAELAAEQYNEYLTNLKPTEDKFISEVMKPTDTLEARERGKVNADTAQRTAPYFANATPLSLTRTLTEPSKAAKAVSAAEIQAGLGVQDKKIAGLQVITDIGEGKRSQAQTGLNSVAADAQKKATITAQTNEDKTGTMIKGAGSAIGAIGGLAKNWPSSSSSETSYIPAVDYSLGYSNPAVMASFNNTNAPVVTQLVDTSPAYITGLTW